MLVLGAPGLNFCKRERRCKYRICIQLCTSRVRVRLHVRVRLRVLVCARARIYACICVHERIPDCECEAVSLHVGVGVSVCARSFPCRCPGRSGRFGGEHFANTVVSGVRHGARPGATMFSRSGWRRYWSACM